MKLKNKKNAFESAQQRPRQTSAVLHNLDGPHAGGDGPSVLSVVHADYILSWAHVHVALYNKPTALHVAMPARGRDQ